MSTKLDEDAKSSALLPCPIPFCKGRARLYLASGDTWYVICLVCNFVIGYEENMNDGPFKTRRAAISAWNRRVLTPSGMADGWDSQEWSEDENRMIGLGLGEEGTERAIMES